VHHTLIVSNAGRLEERDDAMVVSTPLDAIVRLERRKRIRTVVLSGSYARDQELAAFLDEFYPSVRVERAV
jgi:hypothetical protein